MLAFVLTADARAQITEVGSTTEWLRVVRSLPTAGVKLYSSTPTSVTLYNLDLSVYTTIDLPALPGGYIYFGVSHFTESTFDNDPTSIEVAFLIQSPAYVSGVRVVRDDGTAIFTDLNHQLSLNGLNDEMNASPPFFTGEDGLTYMLITSYPTNLPATTKLYQLPGSLPCLDCAQGGGMGIPHDHLTTGTGTLTIFPNPASDQLTVDYDLPPGTRVGRLLVQDALGRLVANLPLTNKPSILDLSQHPSGSYTCSMVADTRIVLCQPLILVR